MIKNCNLFSKDKVIITVLGVFTVFFISFAVGSAVQNAFFSQNSQNEDLGNIEEKSSSGNLMFEGFIQNIYDFSGASEIYERFMHNASKISRNIQKKEEDKKEEKKDNSKKQIKDKAANKQDKEDIPQKVNLDVPFYPQAPDADWSLPWAETCEEASIALAYHFFSGKDLSKRQFKKELLEMVDFQKKLFGKYVDTDIEETAELLEEFYGHREYEIMQDPTVKELKYQLSQKHPIVAPFAGKSLENRFFTNGGPRYHMLVIVGYDNSHFITNDVGTSRGENFTYKYENIMNSLHDLVPRGKGDIKSGDKKVLILK